MVGYLMEYGTPITFLEWVKCGMPFVPLMSVVIGAYMYIRCKSKLWKSTTGGWISSGADIAFQNRKTRNRA